ncbi:MAG: septal ring lytic transglycosylase RlpA family protein [Cyanobacteria bacterium P01_A01_bin.137]
MFDVPVLEVTVSSAPTVINSVSNTNPISLSKSTISLALLSALAVLPTPASASPGITAESVESTELSNQTLFSQNSFQLLEPLDLADAAESLETIFSLPLQLHAPSEFASGKHLLTIPSPANAIPPLEVAASDSADKAAAIDVQPVVTELAKPTPAGLSEHLNQCLDTPPEHSQFTTTFQILRRGTAIGEAIDINSPKEAVQFLQTKLLSEELIPHEITPILGGEQPAIQLSRDVLVRVTNHPGLGSDISSGNQPEISSEWAAITWSDHLRQVLGAPPLDAGDVQVMLKGFQPSDQQLNGLASWYGPYFHGRLTANGETFDQNTLTAAHKSLPFNTVLQVRNLKNNRSIVVRINDRGPYIGKRSLDLSKAAAQCLGSEKQGVIPYEAVILEPPSEELSAN